jgi:hypothetical protein
MSGLGAFLLFFLKKYISKAIDYRFTKLDSEYKARIELEKEKSKHLLTERQAIYPEIVSLVYQLRNEYRADVGRIRKELSKSDEFPFHFIPSFGEKLFILTHNLYKYRAFIPEGTFNLVHRFKRILQDVEVYGNKLTRNRESDERSEDQLRFEQDLERHIIYFEENYNEVDELYCKIVKEIQEHMKGISNDF